VIEEQKNDEDGDLKVGKIDELALLEQMLTTSSQPDFGKLASSCRLFSLHFVDAFKYLGSVHHFLVLFHCYDLTRFGFDS
jgi:hypothetical protein